MSYLAGSALDFILVTKGFVVPFGFAIMRGGCTGTRSDV